MQMNTLGILRALHNLTIQSVRYSKLQSDFVVPIGKDLIVCWHPERAFPYEESLPLPKEEPKAVDSVLKIGAAEIAEVFKRKRNDIVVHELAKMTYTTKHRWYPRSRDKKAKKTKPNRTYL